MYTIEEMAEVLNVNKAVLLNHVKNLLPLDETPKSKYFKHKDGEWSITFKGALYLIACFGIDKGNSLDRFEELFLLKNGIGGLL